MAGFERDRTVDSSGYRGLIPDNTTIPVVVIDAQGMRLQKLKTGHNAGKIASIYKPVFEVAHGTYRGGRVYGDLWCNVMPNAVTGKPEVFGSHLVFCDMCDACGIKEADGGYPTATNEQEGATISMKMIGKAMFITVGTRDYPKNDGSTGTVNTVKSIVPMSEEQMAIIADEIPLIMTRIEKQRAKKAARSGGSGLEGLDSGPSKPDNDMPY